MKLWTPTQLAEMGKALNKTNIRPGYMEYCGGKPGLDTAIAYAVLVIANSTPDDERLETFLRLLHGRKGMGKGAYKALEIRRWSPVRKALDVYPDLVRDNNRPDLDELVAQQRVKTQRWSPSWATLMPDKVYALARFCVAPI